MGPMTGRAAGYCAGSAAPGFVSGAGGRGFGGGGGGGRRGHGRRNQFYATGLTGWQRVAAGMPAFGGGQVGAAPQAGPDASPEVSRERDLGMLKQHAENMEQEVKQLRERIQQLETES